MKSNFYNDQEILEMEELEDDLATEKMDMAERIEAGLATPEEIMEYMQQDAEFMNKYFGN